VTGDDAVAASRATVRNIVDRIDGQHVHVPRTRGHLFVCADGCCCGRTQDGFPPLPRELFHQEWERRRLRNRVHLTIGGCLGPCALANVVMLLFDGRQVFFQSVNSGAIALALYDYIEALLGSETDLSPPPLLAPLRFTASTWQARSDGMAVVDSHLRPDTGAGAEVEPDTL